MNLAKKTNTETREDNFRGRLLIVDDDTDILDSLSDLISDSHDYLEILCASTEDDARQIAESRSIDIALLDIRLGQKNGLDLVPLLKQKNRYISCLMMTAYRDVQYAVNAIRFGADDYLHKPLEPEHLLSTIDRFIRYQEYKKERDRAEAWFRTIFDTSGQALFVTKLDGEIVQINSVAAELCAVGDAQAIGKKLWGLGPWAEVKPHSAKLRNAFMAADLEASSIVDIEMDTDNEAQVYEFVIRPLRKTDSTDGCLLVEGRDITRTREKERRLSEKAYTDELTGLPNRAALVQQMAKRVSRGPAVDRLFSVLFLDIDNFKTINDQAGHAEGDRILQEVAIKLQQSVRGGDIVARHSGDEFIAVVEETENGLFGEVVAERIRREVAGLHDARSGAFRISVSIGVARYPEHGKTVDELIGAADEAMYRAKRDGRNRYRLAEKT